MTRDPVPPKAGFKQFWIPAPRLCSDKLCGNDGTGDFCKRLLGLQNNRDNPRMQESGSFLRLRDHAVKEADQAALHFFSEFWATLLCKRQQTFLPVSVGGATFQIRPFPLQLGLKGGME